MTRSSLGGLFDMPGHIIASGSIQPNVVNDVARYTLNAGVNPDIANMTANSQVFLTANAGRRGCYPDANGPVFNASVITKSKGSCDIIVSAISPDRWTITDVNIDYLIIGN
jgi:hypothetical protein